MAEDEKKTLDKTLTGLFKVLGKFNFEDALEKSEPGESFLSGLFLFCKSEHEGRRKRKKKLFDPVKEIAPFAGPGDEPKYKNPVTQRWETETTPEPPEKRYKASKTIGDRGDKVGARGVPGNRASQGSTTRRTQAKRSGGQAGGIKRRKRKRRGTFL